MRKHDDLAGFERLESAALRLGYERPAPALEREDFENVSVFHYASLTMVYEPFRLRRISRRRSLISASFSVMAGLVLACPGHYSVRLACSPNA
jgi:hypothetical protein